MRLCSSARVLSSATGCLERPSTRDTTFADEEFRVGEGLIALGPLPSDDMLPELVDDLEKSGLAYFDDFFELSGNWPGWLTLYARGAKGRGT